MSLQIVIGSSFYYKKNISVPYKNPKLCWKQLKYFMPIPAILKRISCSAVATAVSGQNTVVLLIEGYS